MKKFLLLSTTLFLAFPLIGISGCGGNNQGKQYIENFKEDWEYDSETSQRALELGPVLLEYIIKNKGYFPPAHNSNAFINALKPHLEEKTEKVFYHPKTGNPVEVNPNISGLLITDVEKSGRTILVGITRGDDKFLSGVLHFNPKSMVYVESSTINTGAVDDLLKAGN